jgi:hypothetical protein
MYKGGSPTSEFLQALLSQANPLMEGTMKHLAKGDMNQKTLQNMLQKQGIPSEMQDVFMEAYKVSGLPNMVSAA